MLRLPPNVYSVPEPIAYMKLDRGKIVIQALLESDGPLHMYLFFQGWQSQGGFSFPPISSKKQK